MDDRQERNILGSHGNRGGVEMELGIYAEGRTGLSGEGVGEGGCVGLREGGSQFALDDGIGIVEEPGVGFEAGFGIVIISDTTDAPLEAFT